MSAARRLLASAGVDSGLDGIVVGEAPAPFKRWPSFAAVVHAGCDRSGIAGDRVRARGSGAHHVHLRHHRAAKGAVLNHVGVLTALMANQLSGALARRAHGGAARRRPGHAGAQCAAALHAARVSAVPHQRVSVGVSHLAGARRQDRISAALERDARARAGTGRARHGPACRADHALGPAAVARSGALRHLLARQPRHRRPGAAGESVARDPCALSTRAARHGLWHDRDQWHGLAGGG